MWWAWTAAGGLCGALAGLALGYNRSVARALRAAARAPRDARTGILRGGEPVHIETASPRACLLLHGFMGTPADFGELPAELARAGWDVHAPLLPGHGTHPRELLGLSAGHYAEWAERELLSLRERYATLALVGFSIGGALALMTAGRGGAEALVLVNPYLGSSYRPAFVLPPRWWHAALGRLAPWVVRPRWLASVRRKEARGELVCYRVVPSAAFGTVFELAALARGCRPPEAPVLMVLSRHDRTASPRPARRLLRRAGSARSRLVEFRRSDHIIFLDHDRREAVEAVVGFLEAAAAGACR